MSEASAARPEATATQLHDDAKLRITRFEFNPGEETGWHQHQYDYVVTPVTDCTMLLELPGGGTQQVFIEAGAAYHRQAGTRHNVINDGTSAMSFVEVELK